MFRTTLTLALGIVCAQFAACGGMSTAPSSRGPLQLTVAPTPTFVGDPSSAAFTIRLQNVGTESVTLDFASGCQVMPYVTSRSTGQIVLPPGGGWGCTAVITHLTLGASESHTQVVTFSVPGPARDPFYPVPPGEYAVYARLEDTKYKLQSEPVPFSLR